MPSGNEKTTITNADGGFVFTGLRVGGPYTVTAVMDGFAPAQVNNIYLSAGKTRDVPIGLHLPEEVIEVTGTSLPPNTSARTLITSKDIDELPSVSRDPRDLVRRAPDVSVEGGSRAMSVQGANPRFNSVTVDGIRQDDDFGLNSSGYPTRRSPIALSAIEELAVETSPFDVRYGKFMGGNVNVVTKSGTNDFKGSLFTTYSSDALMGSRSRDDRAERQLPRGALRRRARRPDRVRPPALLPRCRRAERCDPGGRWPGGLERDEHRLEGHARRPPDGAGHRAQRVRVRCRRAGPRSR